MFIYYQGKTNCCQTTLVEASGNLFLQQGVAGQHGVQGKTGFPGNHGLPGNPGVRGGIGPIGTDVSTSEQTVVWRNNIN